MDLKWVEKCTEISSIYVVGVWQKNFVSEMIVSFKMC